MRNIELQLLNRRGDFKHRGGDGTFGEPVIV